MKAVHSSIAGSWAHSGSLGSLRYVAEMIPTDLSRPAGVNTAPTDEETVFRYWTGFQPESYALRIACAAALGVAMSKNTSAPEAFSETICESMVGSVTS